MNELAHKLHSSKHLMNVQQVQRIPRVRSRAPLLKTQTLGNWLNRLVLRVEDWGHWWIVCHGSYVWGKFECEWGQVYEWLEWLLTFFCWFRPLIIEAAHNFLLKLSSCIPLDICKANLSSVSPHPLLPAPPTYSIASSRSLRLRKRFNFNYEI